MHASSVAQSKHLSPLTTSWHNRSQSSLSATSDTATFHSAHAHPSSMELHLLSQTPANNLTHKPSQGLLSPLTRTMAQPLPSPILTSIKMDRQDSGYCDSPTTSSPRTSTSSARPASPLRPDAAPRERQRKRRSLNSPSTSSRPSTKRHSRTTSSNAVRTSTSTARPSLLNRHTTPSCRVNDQPYQFFQFPTFHGDEVAESDTHQQPVQAPPPPATVQYWTSDSTRRLEYAAIDAASKGIKGFFTKLVPDCIIPAKSRRQKFHCNDADSDCGSVRRYRLALPEEKECGSKRCSSAATGLNANGKRPHVGVFRRWSSFVGGKRS